MSESNKCCARIHNKYSWRGDPCGKNAKVEREGNHYCGMHDPVAVKAKADARAANWLAQHNAAVAARKATEEKRESIEKDAGRYRFLKTMPREMVLFWLDSYGRDDAAIDEAMKAKEAA